MPRKYGRTVGHGQPVPEPTLTLIQRLMDWVVESDEGYETPCWLWQGHCDKDGYAEVKWRGKKYRAMLVSYRAFVDKLIQGTDVDHMCTCRSCINPYHGQQISMTENRIILREHRRRVVKEAVPF